MLLPCLNDLGEMIQDQLPNAIEFVAPETSVVLERDRLKPELTGLSVSFHMDMAGLAAIEAVEEESVWPWDPLDRRQVASPETCK